MSRKNLELLIKILMDYPQERLEMDIFTLNHEVKGPMAGKLLARKPALAKSISTQEPNSSQQILLNET